MRITCCKDCTERTEFGRCHSTCEKYLNQVKEKNEAHERYIKENLGNFQLHKRASEKLNKRIKRYGSDVW